MAYRVEKNGDDEDIVVDGFEQGVASSPHKGIANIQGGNISTELSEVMCSFNRAQQTQTPITGGTLTATAGLGSLKLQTSSPLFVGQWINISASTITTLVAANYYVSANDVNGNVTLSSFYDPTAAATFSHGTSGTATFSTSPNMGNPVAYATEYYSTASASYERYYVLDSAGLVWVYDTQNEGTTGLTWFLPDTSTAYFSGTAPSGIAVLNGNLMVFEGGGIWFKPTVCLGNTGANTTTYVQVQTPGYASLTTSPLKHTAFVGHQGRVYYTDGNFIGSIFPDTSIQSGNPNIQCYGSYTAVTTTGTLTSIIGGAKPFQVDSSGSIQRIPAIFFTSPGGALPTALPAGSVYWIYLSGISNNTFNVYAAQTGGAALDIQTGSSGTQYFNTFYPNGTGGLSLITASNERVFLPAFETAQCMAEIGNTVLIGCKSNAVYPWNQVDVTPASIIFLPESNTANIITVNQMAYIFAGNKGHVYITDGSTASLVIKVPDYAAGIPGSPATYIEPVFTWGGAMYLRGRVYFSILDQTSSKTGNCGGVWSFVPTQNLYIGQDTGIALRLENQNSYGTYNGVASLLIPRASQTQSPPLYWSAWYSSVSGPSYGIDYSNTGTNASFTTVIETDAVPVGTMLNKKTYKQVEYKLGAPLDTNAAITAKYRLNLTDAWTALNAFVGDTSKLSGYVQVNFQQIQWLQLQITLTPITSTASSNTFVRLREIRIR